MYNLKRSNNLAYKVDHIDVGDSTSTKQIKSLGILKYNYYTRSKIFMLPNF